MSPKEKAAQLRYKYSTLLDLKTTDGLVLQCALIAVGEIIKQLVPIEKAPNNKSAFQYWEEVKQEIEKI